ncbi:MAG: hypothetical protein ABIW81_02225 [Terrimesophilobacter sp.]
MNSRISVAVMAALLLLYLALVVQLAFRLIAVDEAVARGLGFALLVLPAIGLWALAAELVFGVRSERLARRLIDENRLPLQDLPRSPSGRINRAAADAVFGDFEAETRASPDAWESWYRLGMAYDACGDRRRARGAIRQAIVLGRSAWSPRRER